MFSLIMATFVALPVSAQTGQAGLSIAPPNTDLTVSGGEQVTRTLSVSNEGTASVSVTMSANNFTASGEEGGASYLPSGSGGLSDWMTLSPRAFDLAGGASRDVTVIIDVPSNASAGGHYASVFAYTAASGEVSGSGAAVTTAIAANFLLNVSGNVIESASIAEFSTPRSRLNAGEDVAFTVRITNSGNTHVTPTGVVELFRKGVKVDELTLNENGGAVLPNSTREFTVSSDQALLAGAYSATATVSYGSGEVLSAPAISFAVIGDSSLMSLVAGGLGVLAVLLALALLVGRKKGTVR
jgi:uncharacterized membrane protein